MPDNDQKNVDNTDHKRVTATFAPKTYKKLEKIAKFKGTTNGDALRQAISLTELIVRTIEEDHSKIFIKRDNNFYELIIP